MTTPTPLREALAMALRGLPIAVTIAHRTDLDGSPMEVLADAILAHPSMQAVAEHEAVGRAVARLVALAEANGLTYIINNDEFRVYGPDARLVAEGPRHRLAQAIAAVVAAWGQPVTEQHQHEWAENWHWHGDLSTRADTPVVQCVRCNAVNESEAIVAALGPSEGERT